MNCPIVKGEIALRMPSAPAGLADMAAGKNLLDTLAAHADDCVGLAGNMIGVRKCIIAFVEQETGKNRLMFNPEIVEKSGSYEAEEGCLSLVDKRKTTRYSSITVKFQDEKFTWSEEEFNGFTAQIIQHEIDHCKGIII
ncbi:MAG: peptide deformylase [Coriobacteriia bacterium]|nr:peptide deformylase [Coriobacteriia bacterium]